jgi:hypothetical protein
MKIGAATHGDRRLGVVAIAVAIGALFAPLEALGVGVVAVGLLASRNLKDFEWREPLWVVGSVGLVLVAVASGLPELAASGLERGEVTFVWVQAVPLAGAAALLGALIGAPAAVLFAAALVDRALDLRMEGAALACAIGTAVGPLGPLVVAGALRKGILRWLVQIALGLLWIWAWTRWA